MVKSRVRSRLIIKNLHGKERNIFNFIKKCFSKKGRFKTTESLTYLNRRMKGQDKTELEKIQARGHIKNKDWKGALKHLDQALDYFLSGELFGDRALVYIRMGDYDRALGDLNEGLCLEPDNIKLFEMRGKLFEKLGRSDEATQDFQAIERIIDKKENEELEPLHSADEYIDRGNHLMDLGEYKKALRDFDAAIEMNPRISEAFLGRGAILKALGETEKAKEDFTRARELDEENRKLDEST